MNLQGKNYSKKGNLKLSDKYRWDFHWYQAEWFKLWNISGDLPTFSLMKEKVNRKTFISSISFDTWSSLTPVLKQTNTMSIWKDHLRNNVWKVRKLSEDMGEVL